MWYVWGGEEDRQAVGCGVKWVRRVRVRAGSGGVSMGSGAEEAGSWIGGGGNAYNLHNLCALVVHSGDSLNIPSF